mgnify:CR=1 FL=1
MSPVTFFATDGAIRHMCLFLLLLVLFAILGVGQKSLNLRANPSMALILHIAIANLVFGGAMLVSGVAVLSTRGGFLRTFSENSTNTGDPTMICRVQGGVSFLMQTVAGFFCVALSIASFRLTRGKPFVSNTLGAVAVYLICYGVPLVMTSVALGLNYVSFQTQNGWCSVAQYVRSVLLCVVRTSGVSAQRGCLTLFDNLSCACRNEFLFILVPDIICVVVVIIMISLMGTFAAKMHRAGGSTGKNCLSLQYMRLLLFCLSFALVTVMSVTSKIVHSVSSDDEGTITTLIQSSTYAYDMANAVVYVARGHLTQHTVAHILIVLSLGWNLLFVGTAAWDP